MQLTSCSASKQQALPTKCFTSILLRAAAFNQQALSRQLATDRCVMDHKKTPSIRNVGKETFAHPTSQPGFHAYL